MNSASASALSHVHNSAVNSTCHPARIANIPPIESEQRSSMEAAHTSNYGFANGPVLISARMKQLYDSVAKIARAPCPVLILGESGTGKELVARSIHSGSKNHIGPFVAVDCGALAPSIIESELFGHAKGAFTGADRPREGLLTAAAHGTVFLDEIGELPLELQAKLLRTLQQKEVRPIGSNAVTPLKARVVSATNRDLLRMVEQGSFRKDLFFRLNVISLTVPPLRERVEDIAALAQIFLSRLRLQYEVDFILEPMVADILRSYEWPGNVRELENVIERACALATDASITIDNLPTHIRCSSTAQALPSRLDCRTQEPLPMALNAGSLQPTTMEFHTRQVILNTLSQLGGDRKATARALGIGKSTLYRKLNMYGA